MLIMEISRTFHSKRVPIRYKMLQNCEEDSMYSINCILKAFCVDIYKKISLTCNERWFQLYSGQHLSYRECPPRRWFFQGIKSNPGKTTRQTDRQLHALVCSQNSRSPSPHCNESHKTCLASGRTLASTSGLLWRVRHSSFEGVEKQTRPISKSPRRHTNNIPHVVLAIPVSE